jgi:acyl carrier protein
MTESEVRSVVFRILRKIAPEASPNQIRPDENLREALDIDSFDFLNFIIGLHEEFKIEIPESDYRKLSTLGNLVGYLSSRLK